MPRKPPIPCKYHGCPELTEDRFCEKHKKLYERKSASKRGYDFRWKKARARFLKANPLCIQCLGD